MDMTTVPAVEREPGPHREQRYQEIILSSIEVFSRTNYEKATTAMIAREAGVAEGTLYKYFATKKELFLECFRYISQLLVERYVAIYEDTGHEPRAYLLAVSKSYFQFLQENPGMRRFLAFVLNNSFDQEFRDELYSFTMFNVNAAERMIRRAIEKGEVRADIKPRIAAWIFVGGYFTLFLMSELDAEEFNDPGFIDDLMGIFLL